MSAITIAFDKEILIELLSAGPEKELLKFKWLELGRGLCLDETSLNSIAIKQKNPKLRLGECLALWFSSTGTKAAPLTWMSFLKALVLSGEKLIAQEINSKLTEFVPDDDLSKSLEEAQQKGYITTRWTKFTISGPPGSGKTSAIKLLLDEKVVVQHDSTPVAMAAKVRTYNIIAEKENVRRSTHDQIWKKVETPKEISDVDQETDHPKDETIHRVYAVDTGGQAAFLDIIPALLRYNSVSIVTHKLDEDLDAKVELYYSVQGEQFKQPNQHQLTHRQLLESVIRPSMIQKPELDMIQAKSHSPKDRPSFIVLGTYFDKIDYKDSRVLAKSNSLNKTLEHFRSDVNIFECPLQEGGSSWIFPVNTLHRHPDCKSSQTARKMRRQICKSFIEADVPKLWFDFHQKLSEKQGSDVIHVSECTAVGASLKMSAADIRAALMYYHSLTIILYFPNILPDYVFLNPQPLFDKLTHIIISSYSQGEIILQSKGIDLPSGAQRDLDKKGIFTNELLEELSRFDQDKLCTTPDLIKLMTELSIIVRLPKEDSDKVDKYFLPSVLPFCDPQDKTDEFQKSCKVKPLLIVWNKVMPRGFFCTLVLHLLQHEVFARDSFLSSYPGEKEIKQHRNAIELPCCSTKGGKVMLVDGITRLQVHYTGQNLSKCYEMQQTLMEVICNINKKYAYNLGKSCFGFFSTHAKCVRSNGVSHSSILNDEMIDLTCNGCQETYKVNTELERPWLGPFTDISTEKEMDKTPSLTELTQHIRHIPQWYKLGEYLKVDIGELDNLTKRTDGLQTKLVLAKWLSASSSKRQVIEALRKIGREDIALYYTDAIKATQTDSQKEETDDSDNLKKKPKKKDLIKIFFCCKNEYYIIGTALEVDVSDLMNSPTEPDQKLIKVFNRWIASDNEVTWEKMLEVCNDYPEIFGKAKTKLEEVLKSK